MFGGLDSASASLLADNEDSSDVSSPSNSFWNKLTNRRQQQQPNNDTAASYQPPSASPSSSFSARPTSDRRPVPVYRPSVAHPVSSSASSSGTGIARGAPLMAADPLDPPRPPPPSLASSSSYLSFAGHWLRVYAAGSWSQMRYYMKHARTEMSKRKFNYCLGCFSCFVVVTVAAVCYTLIARAPVVFLQQAEAAAGQFDARLTVDGGANANFINHTQLTSNLAIRSELAYHTPRLALEQMRVWSKQCSDTTAQLGLDPFVPDWKYVGYGDSTTRCRAGTTRRLCLETLCPGGVIRDNLVTIYGIDSDREKAMGLGRLWAHPKLQPGEAVISKPTAQLNGLSVGDVFFVSTVQPTWSRYSYTLANEAMTRVHGANYFDDNTTALISSFMQWYGAVLALPLRVAAIASDWKGKLDAGEDNAILVEFDNFLSYALPQQHPALRLTDVALIRNITLQPPQRRPGIATLPFSLYNYTTMSGSSLYEHTDQVLCSLPPSRIDAYMSSNYDDIQDTVINWASLVMYYASFPQVNIDLPILNTLYGFRFFSLFLGLILSVILTILFILSTMLIYSLLMISIETRTFELGVHRMVGMQTTGIIKMLLTQACSYSVPAWVVGLILSQLLAAYITSLLEARVEVPVSRLLTSYAIWVATFLGLVIPLIAAILPIRVALSKNLHDSLDTQHSKTLGVQFDIERSEDAGLNSAWLSVGGGFVVFGFLIYYLLPLSLLSFNLALFFNLFFGLLLGLLFGLILLALNFQHILERILLRMFFFWERPQIPFIVRKNLIAHRARNRKTSIMFALSLGFIIFITVAYAMEITSARFRELQQNGQSVTASVRGGSAYWDMDAVADYEQFLSKSPLVEDWAWMTNRMATSGSEWSSTLMTNLGHAYSANVWIYGVTSNFFDVALSDFLIADTADSSTSLTLSEQLYTVRGSQSVLVGTNAKNFFHIDTLDSSSSFLFSLQKNSPPSRLIARLKPLAFLNLGPRLGFTQYPTSTTQVAVVSLPTFVALSNGVYESVANVLYSGLVIKQRSGNSDSDVDALVASLKDVGSRRGGNVYDSRSLGESVAKADAVMALIFDSATYIAMGLCLFSLMASMYTNIYEQSKEIAIVRAMGLSSFSIIRIYTYEAFVLVLAASLLGMCIGALMSATMSAQRVLFTQLPVSVPFPWTLVVMVLVGSVLCALVASCMPARQLMNKKIASIMRTVL